MAPSDRRRAKRANEYREAIEDPTLAGLVPKRKEEDLRLDLVDADPATLSGAERMDRARALSAVENATIQRDVAIQQVEAADDLNWDITAYDFLLEYLHDHPFMFVDDLWESGLPHTHEDRALGALFLRASKAGFMAKTGQFRKSVRSNMTEKPVWKSLIFKPEL